MSSDAHVMKFILLVEGFFPRPKFDGDEKREAAWLRVMQDQLRGWPEPILMAAGDRILKTRNPTKPGFRWFPAPAEILAVCEDIAAERERAQRPLLAAPKGNEWSDERLALAFDLCKSPLGIEAAREGWILRLYDFCRREMRLPEKGEVMRLRHEAQGIDKAIAKIDSSEPSALNGALRAFAASVLAKRNELSAKILGRAA